MTARAGTTSTGPPGVLLEERRGPALLLTLNRPDRLNAVSAELYERLLGALDAAASDPGVRAVVLTGAGRAFCVGADLVAHAEGAGSAAEDPDGPTSEEVAARERYARLAADANLGLQTSPVPVVAAVNGHAIGAGLELALSCDLVVVSRSAKLRLPEAALGTFVGGGVTRTLARRVGGARARELLLLCPFVQGDEAEAMGLANRVVDGEEVLPLALDWAGELATRAPVPVALLKELLHVAPELGTAELMDREVEALVRCMATGDWREGLRAFHEKRLPRYTGR